MYFPNILPFFPKCLLLVSTIFIGACARISTPAETVPSLYCAFKWTVPTLCILNETVTTDVLSYFVLLRNLLFIISGVKTIFRLNKSYYHLRDSAQDSGKILSVTSKNKEFERGPSRQERRPLATPSPSPQLPFTISPMFPLHSLDVPRH